jgi:hypothetical protein
LTLVVGGFFWLMLAGTDFRPVTDLPDPDGPYRAAMTGEAAAVTKPQMSALALAAALVSFVRGRSAPGGLPSLAWLGSSFVAAAFGVAPLLALARVGLLG